MKFIKILILLLVAANYYAQNNNFLFEHFDTKDGLTQNSVTAIVQDEHGYLWFSTQNGLNKFDGYNFTAYLFDPDDKKSMQGNWINHLIADKHGKIWIFFGFGGIDCFDINTEEFEQYIHDEKKPSPLPEKYLRYAYLDKWDNLWLGTFENGILKFDRDKNTFIKYSNDLLDKFSLSSNRTLCAFADTLNGNKNLWIGTANAGINKMNIETGEIERIQWRNFKPSKKLYDFINSKNNERKKIASIIKAGDAVKINREFFLKEKSKLLIVCQGEALFNNNIDYGKIRKGNKTVWESNAVLSAHAGGEIRNRIQFDIIELEQGNYNLDFQTDSSHSFTKWYNNAPDFPELWGIQVYKLTSSDIPLLQNNIDDIEKRTSMNSHNITAFERINNDLWIGTWGGGLNKMNLITGEFSNYKILNKGNNFSKNYSREFLKDSKNRIWLIDKDFYLSCFDTESEKFINISTADYNFDKIFVTEIIKDTEGTIWAGTRKEGLYQIAFAANGSPVVKHYQYNKQNTGSLSHNTINYLFQDVSGNMWIATNGGGINKFNNKKQKFKLIDDNINSTPRLSSGRVTSFAEDNSGNIWISTLDGGLNKFYIKENKIEKVNLPDEIFKNISTLYFDGDENLYIGLYVNGVYKYNIKTKNYIKINGGKYLDIIYGNSVSCITKDKEKNLWVGLYNFGALRINEKTGDIKHFTQIYNDSTSLPSVAVWNIYVDKNSDVWIATASGGLSKLIKGTSKFKTYSNIGKDPYRFPNNTATCFYEDSKGNFWVGSFSAGLSLMDREAEKFKYYTIKNGLPGNRIDGIQEDEDGNLWISTNNGISKFDPVKKTFRNYDYMDGLQDNEFTRKASLKTKTGIMFFGGDHGLNYFHPDEIKDNLYIPKINITAFKKSNEEIKFDKSLEAVEKIELDYNEVQISFEFVTLDYTSPEKNKYAYKMEGFDNDWIYSGKRRYANYTNLFRGEYVFKVIGSNSDGVWNTEGASIKIIVHPPFWNTWWFYLLAAAVLFSSAFSIHRYIVQKKINQMLEHEKIRNSEREKVREELSRDFHDELGHKLTRISMYARNVIKKKNSSSTELINELEKVNETSQSLHLGAKDLIWSLNPGEDTLYDTVIRLKDFGDDLFDKTGINFGAKGISEDFKSIKLPMEWKRHLTLIFKESMNNILKYAECNNVLLRIEVENKILKIELSDDGKGFEINGDSNGYGLHNIKKRAENIKGTIDIVSEENKGTLIIFSAEISHLYD